LAGAGDPVMRPDLSASDLVASVASLDEATFAGWSPSQWAVDDSLVIDGPAISLIGEGEAHSFVLGDGWDGAADLAAVDLALAAIPVLGDTSRWDRGPVVLGALPFSRTEPAHLTLPERLVGVGPSGPFAVFVHPRDQLLPSSWPDDLVQEMSARSQSPVVALGASQVEVTSVPSRSDWVDLIARALAELRSGYLDKVVLARSVRLEFDQELSPADLLRRLAANPTGATHFKIGGFLGVTPELLVARRRDQVLSWPLAGTTGGAGARLASSPKDRKEHALVVQAVAGVLAPLCTELSVPGQPSLLRQGPITHLGTAVAGRLSIPLSSLELAARLHPTPATGGHPVRDAVDYIDKVEGQARGLYAGAVGWMDATGDGDWMVAIRSAQVDGRVAVAHAGNGIVAESDPLSELAETDLKLRIVLSALIRP
jgi:menaquinone-specific isochorismate synthase